MRMSDEDTVETFSYLVRAIRDKFPTFSYLHAPEPRVAGTGDQVTKGESNDFLKEIWLNGMQLPSKIQSLFANRIKQRVVKTTVESTSLPVDTKYNPQFRKPKHGTTSWSRSGGTSART